MLSFNLWTNFAGWTRRQRYLRNCLLSRLHFISRWSTVFLFRFYHWLLGHSSDIIGIHCGSYLRFPSLMMAGSPHSHSRCVCSKSLRRGSIIMESWAWSELRSIPWRWNMVQPINQWIDNSFDASTWFLLFYRKTHERSTCRALILVHFSFLNYLCFELRIKRNPPIPSLNYSCA